MVAQVDFEMTVGEDWTVQLTLLDEYDRPRRGLQSFPARMDVVSNFSRQIQLSLQAPEQLDPTEIPGIAVSGASGTVQLHVPRAQSDNLLPGTYSYDLWLTWDDYGEYAGTQTAPEISGQFIVHDRITEVL